MKHILLLNGPNLNLLGTREPQIYGHTTLADIERHIAALGATFGIRVESFQGNGEGELVGRVHRAREEGAAAAIVNAGAYTHTSVALRDALAGTALPFVEVHISNVYKREAFRHHSYLSDIAIGVIAGLGVYGYEAALRFLVETEAV
ncbi:TPA: type II 3-dehydroquinate dehydratase [Neisseria bacilliformis]|uniref:3-dehydroquinate dehydratase n=1 Tax=Neisseria bacilliformis ATCC BAA-1200 TaxID=888742 RepID=F2BAU3_9NEIS|nr:type II 3-dehydroquinate dehydratase [Neisseria bacilliformis]EGF11439.1 3-dehydroquinate dehydratase [Neisseria bacilliformis ATCC BAA-1200]QMT47996.1 type II 3-dehydroquinate dehydratase [Neisseria bacilliformis]